MKHLLVGLLMGAFFSSAALAGQEVTLTDQQGHQLGSATNPLSVGAPAPPAAITTGQLAIAATGTAVQFPTVAGVNGLVIKAWRSNAADVCIGGSSVTTTENGTGNAFCLAPGETMSVPVSNFNADWMNGTAGDWVFYAGN